MVEHQVFYCSEAVGDVGAADPGGAAGVVFRAPLITSFPDSMQPSIVAEAEISGMLSRATSQKRFDMEMCQKT